MLYLRINDLLPEHQSAYRSCHSTESALLKVTSDALLAADQGKLTLLGMLDMSAAFDCVDHIILVRRLNVSFGIDENALEWNVSYITGRRQYVRYNGRTSEISVVECGVPQGSVLGPLYFVLFTAAVFGIADEHGFAIHGYADDMQIYDHCVVDDMHHLTSRLVGCIGSIGVWMTNNRLKLNASKTEFIWFGSARRLARCTFESIVINGSSSLPSKTVRNLGVVLDPSSSQASHVIKLTSTVYFHIRQLRTIHRTLTNDACHALVRALVLSRLDYCNVSSLPKHQTIFWLNCPVWCVLLPDSDSSYLEKVTFLTPSVAGSTGLTSRSVFVSNCVLARRCIHGSAPSYLSKYCIPVSSIAGRSHLRSAASGDLFIPATNTVTIGPRAFAVACPAAWNIGTVFRQNSMTRAWVWWRSGRNWKLIYSKSTSKLLCDFGAWCKSLLAMLLWLS